MNQLTILIPTYNRPEHLSKTLSSIYKQGHIGEYNIIISDNHSDYDVLDLINKNYNKDFCDNIQIITWGFNMGMASNLSVPFTFVKTNWCWLIGDDDDILEGALDTLFCDINSMDNINTAAIKYSTQGLSIHPKNLTFDNVTDISNYYLNNFKNRSDRWYLSLLFNMKLLKPYLTDFTLYSYSALSFWIPIIRSVNEKNGVFKISNKVLIRYHDNMVSGWFSNPKRYLQILIQVRTTFDSFHGMDYNTYRLFKRMILGDNSDFRCRTVVNLICQCETYYERKVYYHLLKEYMVGNFFSKFLYKSFYYLVLLFNVSPLTIRRMLRKN